MRRVARRATQVLTVILAAFFLVAVPAQAVASAQAAATVQALAPPIPIPLPPVPGAPPIPVVPGFIQDQLKKIPIPTGRDCLNPPMAANPSAGLPHLIDSGPPEPLAGDPFNKGSKATMYDRYGYAGFALNTFEIPNKLDICQPFNLDPFQTNANIQADVSLATIAIATRLTRLVTSGTLGAVWDPLQETLTSTFGGKLFLSLSGVAIAIAGSWVLWQRGRKGQISHVFSWAGKAMTILLLGAACTFYVVGVGGGVDRTLKVAVQSAGEVATAGARDPADLVGSILVDKVMYPTWQRQMFGENHAARDEYSERLWKAGNFTREEQAANDADVASAGPKIEERKAQYKAVMLEIQDKYPAAYPQAAGQNTQGQLGDAAAASLSVSAASWFLIGLLMLLVWASIIARIGIGIFPAVSIPALFPKLHGMAVDVGTTIVMSAWQAVIAAFAVFVYLGAVLVPIMGADFDPFLKIVMVLLASVAMAKVLKRLKVTPGAVISQFRKGKKRKEKEKEKSSKKSSSEKSSKKPGDKFDREPGEPGKPGKPGSGMPAPREAKQQAKPANVGVKVAVGAPNVNLGNIGDLKSAASPARSGPAGAPGRRGEFVAVSGSGGRVRELGGAASTAVASAGKKKALAAGVSTAAKATPHGRAVVVGATAVKVASNARGLHQTSSAPRVRPPVTKLGVTNAPASPMFKPGAAGARATVVQGHVVRRGHHTPAPEPAAPAPAAPKSPAPVRKA